MYPSFFFQAEDGIRVPLVTGVQTCALPILHAVLAHRGQTVRHDLDGRRGGRHGRVELELAPRGGLAQVLAAAERPVIEVGMVLVHAARRSEERRVGTGCRGVVSPSCW